MHSPGIKDPTNTPAFLERMRQRDAAQRPPQWLQRARAGALYGTDTNGKPIVKDLTGQAA